MALCFGNAGLNMALPNFLEAAVVGDHDSFNNNPLRNVLFLSLPV